MKVDLETIANARAQSFSAIANDIATLRARIENAGTSQKDASTQVDLTVFNNWVDYVSKKSYQKGECEGYALACTHMLSSIDELLAQVQAQYAALEEAVKSLQSVENLLDEQGEESAPLD